MKSSMPNKLRVVVFMCTSLVARKKYQAEGYLVKFQELRFAVWRGIAQFFMQMSLNLTANCESVYEAVSHKRDQMFKWRGNCLNLSLRDLLSEHCARLDPAHSILMTKLYADLHSASDWLLIDFECSQANNQNQSEPASSSVRNVLEELWLPAPFVAHSLLVTARFQEDHTFAWVWHFLFSARP